MVTDPLLQPDLNDSRRSDPNHFGGFEEAYLHNLALLQDNSAATNQARGISSLERLSVLYNISDPRRRLITSSERRANLVFCFAEALWYVNARDDLAYLAYYAPSVRQYSADGTKLTGTAYGPRIFGGFGGDSSQWEQVVATLNEDRETKRAFVMIAVPHEDRALINPDVACTLSLQYLVRGNRLHATSYMRANDAYRGSVSDVFSFTFLQELLATRLGVPLGSYSHFVGSYHLYANDYKRAGELLSAPLNSPVSDRMPEMPDGDNRSHIEVLMKHEEALREDRDALGPAGLSRLDLPAYWKHVLTIFELYRQVRYGVRGTVHELLTSLPDSYQFMLGNRFPTLGSTAAHVDRRSDPTA